MEKPPQIETQLNDGPRYPRLSMTLLQVAARILHAEGATRIVDEEWIRAQLSPSEKPRRPDRG